LSVEGSADWRVRMSEVKMSDENEPFYPLLRHYLRNPDATAEITLTDNEGKSFTVPHLPDSIERAIREGAATLAPRDLAIVIARYLLTCKPSGIHFTTDAISIVATGKPAVASRLVELIEPAVVHEARRRAVAVWHLVLWPIHLVVGVILCAVLAPDWAQCAVALVALFAMGGLARVARVLGRHFRPRERRPPTNNFVAADYVAILGSASASVGLIYFSAFVSGWAVSIVIGLAAFSGARAVWLTFSYLCALYGARGSLGGTYLTSRGFAVLHLCQALHVLKRHGGSAQAASLIAAAGGHARRALAARDRRSTVASSNAPLGRDIEGVLLSRAADLHFDPAPRVIKQNVRYLESALRWVAKGDWARLGQGQRVAALHRAPAMRQRAARLVLQILPAVVVLLMTVAMPDWTTNAVIVAAVFAGLVGVAAVADFVGIGSSGDAAGVAAAVASISPHPSR
jgi:hypothetical protein